MTAPQAPSQGRLVFVKNQLEDLIRTLGNDVPLAHLSLKPLDDLIGGVRPGQMYALGATPGAGKTTLLLQCADDLAAQGTPVIFVSGELPPHKLIAKSLSRMANGALDLADIPPSTDEARRSFRGVVERYGELVAPNLCITESCIPEEIDRLVNDCVHERGAVPVLFVDYLQLVATSLTEPICDERLAISACIKKLRGTCNRYGCPLFAISTINRTSYDMKKLNLSAFGGTSTVEYAFDCALILSDDRSAGMREDGVRRLSLTALKNRYGRLGEAQLALDEASATFFDPLGGTR